MTRIATPLLTRLRRYRGLWLLAFAALLLKLATSSVCLGDLPASPLTATATSSVAMSASADVTTADACLLGEAGDCHCACAHALTLTSHMAISMSPVLGLLESPRLSPGLVPEMSGSLLRPPIA
jgi:hypothetical protein